MHEISTFQSDSLTPFTKVGEWHRQRDVTDPADEGEAGIDFDTDCDDVSAEEFLKAVTPDPDERHDQMSRDHNLCGQHLAKIKMHLMLGNHEQANKSCNKAMYHYQKFHAALKSATQD